MPPKITKEHGEKLGHRIEITKKLNQSWGEDAHNKQHKVDEMKFNCRIVKLSAKFIAHHDKNSHR